MQQLNNVLYMDCITPAVLHCAVNRIFSCKKNDYHVYTYIIYPGVSLVIYVWRFLICDAPFSNTPPYHQQCIVMCCKCP